MRDRPNDSAHRRALEAKIGRKLLPNEVAHHVDEDKANNAPANLLAKTRAQHSAEHATIPARNLSKLRAALRMQRTGKKLY
jgi:hypothetical protein